MSEGLKYEVVVGNIGSVYLGSDEHVARATFQEYVRQSKESGRRASRESVWMFFEDELVREFVHRRGV